jgi:hypothetical protein
LDDAEEGYTASSRGRAAKKVKGDFESHRVLTRSGKFKALVFPLVGGRCVMKTPLSLYACVAKDFESLEKLEAFVRQRGWKLERVSWFT